MSNGLDAHGLVWDCDPLTVSPVKMLWGVAPTGDIHLGYVPYFHLLRSLRDLGTEPVILIANYHAYFDSQKTKWPAIQRRTAAYRHIFNVAGFPEVLETRDFYLRTDYIEALFEFSGHLGTIEALQSAQSTLATRPHNATVADFIYVATMILDIQYLGVDSVLCGIDEAGIYRLGLPLLARYYGRHCHYVFMPMCPGIEAPEMHASDPVSNKILLTDRPATVRQKVERHVSAVANGLHASSLAEYCRTVLLPLAGNVQQASELAAALDSGQPAQLVDVLSAAISEVLASWQGNEEPGMAPAGSKHALSRLSQ